MIFFPCSHCVPMGFPKLFAQDVPNSTSELFYGVCPKSNSHVHKLRRWIIGEHILSILWPASEKVLLLGSAQCSQKHWWCANQCGSFKEAKKKMLLHPWTLGGTLGPSRKALNPNPIKKKGLKTHGLIVGWGLANLGISRVRFRSSIWMDMGLNSEQVLW